jgi:hypothetical protein
MGLMSIMGMGKLMWVGCWNKIIGALKCTLRFHDIKNKKT